MKDMIRTTRKLSLDTARIIAVMCVLMIHVAMNFVEFDINTSSFLCGNIFDSLARAGVPLFVMVSGALMLDEEKQLSTKIIFTKYIWNIIWLFFVWSCFYTIIYIVKCFFDSEPINFKGVVLKIVSGEFHMWYLIMIIGLYMIVPILRLFAKKENSKLIVYAIMISLFFQFLSTFFSSMTGIVGIFQKVTTQLARFEFEFIGTYATYFITGWYISNVGVKYKKSIYFLSAFAAVAIIGIVQITGEYQDVYQNSNLLVYIYSVGIFTFIDDVCRGKCSGHLIANLSNLAFGVYIIHIFVLHISNLIFNNVEITILSIVIKYIFVTSVSFFGSYILSKMPIFKKLIRC